MAMPIYSSGTATISAGGTTVYLADATTDFNNVFAGDKFNIGTTNAEIIDVIDDETFSITPWPGSDETASAYQILQSSPLRFTDVEIAIDLKKQVQALNTEGFYVFVPSDATEPDPSLGDDGQYAFQAATGKLWAKESGAWVFLGVYKGFGLPAPYDSGKTYNLFDTATSDGSTYVWINATPGSGHAPPDATYWNVLAGKGEKGDRGEPGEQGSPGTNGLGVPSGGAAGQVLAKASAADNDTGWIDPPQSLPSGGATGQVLAKASATDGDADWIDPPEGGGDVAGDTHAAPSKTTPDDDDELPFANSAASWIIGKFKWSNLKAALASTFFTWAPVREKLTANRTYYVRTDGSDSNNGLSNTSGGAFLTIQKAINIVYGTLDLAGFDVTIQLGNAGTFSGSTLVSSPQVGAGNVILNGDVTPASTGNYIVTSSTGTTITVQNSKLSVQGFELQSSSSQGMTTGTGGIIYVSGYMRFGTCAGWQIRANNQGAIYTSNPANTPTSYAIVGSAPGHAWSSTGSLFNATGSGVTVTTNVTFSTAFVQADRGANLVAGGMSFTLNGTVTGPRYLAQYGGTIYTNGGGASFFPGSTAGSGTNYGASPYGMYI